MDLSINFDFFNNFFNLYSNPYPKIKNFFLLKNTNLFKNKYKVHTVTPIDYIFSICVNTNKLLIDHHLNSPLRTHKELIISNYLITKNVLLITLSICDHIIHSYDSNTVQKINFTKQSRAGYPIN